MLREVCCPCCGAAGRYGRHGFYRKYHWQERIAVLRVRCVRCGVTHALLPTFSLPGTSIGTEEAERYLTARHNGVSRSKASRQLLSLGVGAEYPRRLERRLEVAINRGKALLAGSGEPELGGLEWIGSVCGPTDRPLYDLNRYALGRGVNGLCFCRSTIHLFSRVAVFGRFSHNRASAANAMGPIDSW